MFEKESFIVCRDLKPENILTDFRGCNFGIAKKLRENEKVLFCGAPDCLAPETTTTEGQDIMSDWWQFGILLYEMLCGLPPFHTESLDKSYDTIKNSQVKFPRRIKLSKNF